MPNKSTKRVAPYRGKIAMNEDPTAKSWARHLGVTREELQRAIGKVGNSAAAVRKELGK